MTRAARLPRTLPILPEGELPVWVDMLFRFGCDTVDIASVLLIPEADAERMLHEIREAARG